MFDVEIDAKIQKLLSHYDISFVKQGVELLGVLCVDLETTKNIPPKWFGGANGYYSKLWWLAHRASLGDLSSEVCCEYYTNMVSAIPDNIRHLPNLKAVRIKGWDLEEIPEGTPGIILDNNAWGKARKIICSYTELRYLRIVGDPDKHPYIDLAGVEKLVKLQTLLIDDLYLRSLPDGIQIFRCREKHSQVLIAYFKSARRMRHLKLYYVQSISRKQYLEILNNFLWFTVDNEHLYFPRIECRKFDCELKSFFAKKCADWFTFRQEDFYQALSLQGGQIHWRFDASVPEMFKKVLDGKLWGFLHQLANENIATLIVLLQAQLEVKDGRLYYSDAITVSRYHFSQQALIEKCLIQLIDQQWKEVLQCCKIEDGEIRLAIHPDSEPELKIWSMKNGYQILNKLVQSGKVTLDDITQIDMREWDQVKMYDSISNLPNLSTVRFSSDQLLKEIELTEQLLQNVSVVDGEFQWPITLKTPYGSRGILQERKMNIIDDLLDQDENLCQQITKLDLSKGTLTELPDWVMKLSNLQSLNLRGNSLHELPLYLAELENLRHLDLRWNCLAVLRLRMLGTLFLKKLGTVLSHQQGEEYSIEVQCAPSVWTRIEELRG